MVIVGSGLPVNDSQLGFLNQHREIAFGEATRQTDNHVQSKTRCKQRTGSVLQSTEVGNCCSGLKLIIQIKLICYNSSKITQRVFGNRSVNESKRTPVNYKCSQSFTTTLEPYVLCRFGTN